MSAEAAAVGLGRVVATRAVGLWLGPRRRDQEGRSELSELIRVRVPGLRAQRGLARQFEQIADAVAERLEPLLAHEFRGLTASGRRSALDAVTDTFVRADLSDGAIIGADADPAALARRIRRAVPVPPGLDEPAAALFELLFAECCDCYVRVLKRLPVYTERAVTELLARTTSLSAELSVVLGRLPVRSLYSPQGEGQDEAFRREYLEYVSRCLDEVELFSFAAERVARTRLSVAYVSLRASGDGQQASRILRAGEDGAQDRQVEAVLKDTSRVLLRGEAGSGKTTLLHWLAVTAARNAFEGALSDWNGLMPVLVKLRRYAGRDLPRPETMLDQTAGALTGHMPAAWVDRQLRAGRVLLLVDGVDELAAEERGAVRTWLRGLLHAYPENRVVVTSRPAAARGDWLRPEGFRPVQLDRMRPADLVTFVRRWHEAVLEPGADLPHYERSLLASLQDRPHLQSLASTPLLAALLCALHLNRRGRLPRDRMELYRIALEILLERRDSERSVPSAERVRLSLADKLRLLQDLAWRLSDNGRNEIASDRAAEHVRHALEGMRHLAGVDAESVLEHLVARSGVLRSPAEGRVDFLHRTFQEYLAAADAAAQDHIGNLVGRAHLDVWYETVVMTAGHANRPQRVELMEGILGRAAAEPRHARRLRLLAAACLGTMDAVPEEVRAPLDGTLHALVPPRRRAEASSLAMVGAPLLRRLPPSLDGLSDAAARALVRTAAMVGGGDALDLMERWAGDERAPVQWQLSSEWEYFDPDEYARRVLRRVRLEQVRLSMTHPTQWEALLSLPEARRVAVKYPFTRGLGATEELGELNLLWVPQLRGDGDLSPLAGHPGLTNVSIWGDVPLEDLRPVRELADLRYLQLQEWPTFPSLDGLPGLSQLNGLGVGVLAEDTHLSSLAARPTLEFLVVQGRGKPRGFAHLGALGKLTLLELAGFDLTEWLPSIRSAPARLKTLTLSGCVLPNDLGGLGVFGRLRVTCYNCRTADGRLPDRDSVPEGVRIRFR
ncbi:NACHT domain-containing protein [Streptomyces sp. NPDC101118]|uniref:NACHT domain-containing protein n=1 Tax=Streptomyces sp. NPDC101118 TaxID=3366109 RepID=UPI00381AB04C